MVVFHDGGGNMSELIQGNHSRQFLRKAAFVLLSIISALTLGLIMGGIGTFIYLVIVFPVLIGLWGGRMMTDNARSLKVRDPSLIKWTTLAAAVIIFVTIFLRKIFGDVCDNRTAIWRVIR
jgi:O-antigen/teichoic acid export membrane protein